MPCCCLSDKSLSCVIKARPCDVKTTKLAVCLLVQFVLLALRFVIIEVVNLLKIAAYMLPVAISISLRCNNFH